MGAPVVDSSEHFNHEELVAQVRVLKAQMRVVGTAVEDILVKHNVFVADVEQGFGGLMGTSAQQWQDMARMKDGCHMLETGMAVHAQQLHALDHGSTVSRTEFGEKLDLIAEAAQNFKQQVKDMEDSLKTQVQRVELETVPADLRRAHAGMSAELAKFRAEHGGGITEGKVEPMITASVPQWMLCPSSVSRM